MKVEKPALSLLPPPSSLCTIHDTILSSAFCGTVFCQIRLFDSDFVSFPFVGAWWLGFLVNGIILLLLSVPIACFPRSLGESGKDRKELVGNRNTGDSIRNVRATDILSSNKGKGFKEMVRGKYLLPSNVKFLVNPLLW